MDIKKARVSNHIVDVIPLEELYANPNRYPAGYNAVIKDDMVFPIRNKSDDKPGVYLCGPIAKYIYPHPNDTDDYSVIKNVIDFNHVESIRDVIEKQDALNSMERTLLTTVTVDNIFVPPIMPTDGPEMKAMKQAVIAKQIDLEKYESRMGANYNNDRRLFNRPNMTLAKMISMADVFDMKLTLTISDKSPDVPNPIGTVITVDLTDGE